MKNKYTAIHSSNYRLATGSIRKATFDQRKSTYLKDTGDRLAIFIEQSNEHNNLTKIYKNI